MQFSNFILDTNLHCPKCKQKFLIEYSKSLYKLSFHKIVIDIDTDNNLFILNYRDSLFSDKNTISMKVDIDTNKIIDLVADDSINVNEMIDEFIVNFGCFKCYFDKTQKYGYNVNYKFKNYKDSLVGYLYSYNFVYLYENSTFAIECNLDANNLTINKKNPNAGINLTVLTAAIPLETWHFNDPKEIMKALNTLFLLI